MANRHAAIIVKDDRILDRPVHGTGEIHDEPCLVFLRYLFRSPNVDPGEPKSNLASLLKPQRSETWPKFFDSSGVRRKMARLPSMYAPKKENDVKPLHIRTCLCLIPVRAPS